MVADVVVQRVDAVDEDTSAKKLVAAHLGDHEEVHVVPTAAGDVPTQIVLSEVEGDLAAEVVLNRVLAMGRPAAKQAPTTVALEPAARAPPVLDGVEHRRSNARAGDLHQAREVPQDVLGRLVSISRNQLTNRSPDAADVASDTVITEALSFALVGQKNWNPRPSRVPRKVVSEITKMT